MKPVRTIIYGVCALAAVWVGMNFSNKPPFHAPQTEAEKALDALLQKVGDDEYLFENAHIRSGNVPVKQRVDYSHLLSKPLMTNLAAQEKQMLVQDCNDVYIDGESCGFDYNPITCAQDVSTNYTYQTIHADATNAVIDYSWPLGAGRSEKTLAHYALVKDADGWRIDSVQCVFE